MAALAGPQIAAVLAAVELRTPAGQQLDRGRTVGQDGAGDHRIHQAGARGHRVGEVTVERVSRVGGIEYRDPTLRVVGGGGAFGLRRIPASALVEQDHVQARLGGTARRGQPRDPRAHHHQIGP